MLCHVSLVVAHHIEDVLESFHEFGLEAHLVTLNILLDFTQLVCPFLNLILELIYLVFHFDQDLICIGDENLIR